MIEKEQVIEKLKKSTKDLEEKEIIISICDEIFRKYYSGSSETLSNFLGEKANSLEKEFDEAYDMLQRKIGL